MVRPLAPSLASALEAQNAGYEASSARDANLRALRRARLRLPGQQTGLLSPLYTVYKAASAIRLARFLTETWGAPVVPVFWLQTEDHDAAEISVCHTARGSDEPLTSSIEVEDNGVPVAHRALPDAIVSELAKLGEVLTRLPHGEEHLASLAAHYRPGAGWSQAFAGVLATLFAEEGLVLLDPRDPALAALAAPVHRRALTEAVPIARALAECSTASPSGFASPCTRAEPPLSFLIRWTEGPALPSARGVVLSGGTGVALARRL